MKKAFKQALRFSHTSVSNSGFGNKPLWRFCGRCPRRPEQEIQDIKLTELSGLAIFLEVMTNGILAHTVGWRIPTFQFTNWGRTHAVPGLPPQATTGTSASWCNPIIISKDARAPSTIASTSPSLSASVVNADRTVGQAPLSETAARW